MKTRIFKMLWVIALSTPLCVQAQNSIKGKVTNQDGQALSGAKITIENTYQSVLSDPDGNFSINGLKNETYTLQAAFAGYELNSKTVNLKGNLTEVNFVLNSSAMMIEEVQVSATRADEKTPTTYTNLSKDQVGKGNYGQDLPYLLEGNSFHCGDFRCRRRCGLHRNPDPGRGSDEDERNHQRNSSE